LHAEEIFGGRSGSVTRENNKETLGTSGNGLYSYYSSNIIKYHGNGTTSADVMNIEGIQFLNTASSHIQFTTIGKPESKEELANGITKEDYFYKRRGFVIKDFLTENEFEGMRDE
jgi:hypothetical protein